MTNSAQKSAQPLDEVMMAMDVVDTLRHRAHTLTHELNKDNQDKALIKRLRQIYQSQGIEVTDEILKKGVAALREDRFTYKPTKDSLFKKIAKLYVKRDQWLKPVCLLFLLIIIGWGIYYFTVTRPGQQAANQIEMELSQTFPETVSLYFQKIQELTEDQQVLSKAELYQQDAISALQEKDHNRAQTAVQSIKDLAHQLERSFKLRIISKPGQQSGIWRTPNDNPRAQNFYLIVEAISPKGDAVQIDVINEETGKTSKQSIFGVRVSSAVFETVKQDKLDDGIIQNNIIAEKPKGSMNIKYNIPVLGGMITSW